MLDKNFNKVSVDKCLDKIIKIILFYNNEKIISKYEKFNINIEKFEVTKYRKECKIRINLCNYEVEGLNLYLYSKFILVDDCDNIDEYNLLSYVTKYLLECGEELKLNFTLNHVGE